MKGAIVAVLDALRRLRQSGTPLKYRPVLAFCTDEEGGKYPGIRFLAETRQLPPLLLNLNGSAENRIWAGCFGSLTYELTFTGKTAHSGTPEVGINALEESLPAVLALMKLKETVEKRESDMPARPWASGPLRARLTLTSIKSGDMGSAIPGECRIIINRRYLPEEKESRVHEELMSVLTSSLAASQLLDWSMTETGHLPPVKNPDGPGTDRWTAARAAAADIPTSDFTRYGSSTSSDFGWVQRAGIQHMLLGGLSRPERNVHGPDEYTTKEDLVLLSKSVENFLSASFDLPDTSSSSSFDSNP
jgi:succinyl-diaminopimelate desuccinylase